MPPPKTTARGLRAPLAVHEERSSRGTAGRENATRSGMPARVEAPKEPLGTTPPSRGRGTLTAAGASSGAIGPGVIPRAPDRLRRPRPEAEVTVIEERPHPLVHRAPSGELDPAPAPACDAPPGPTAGHPSGDGEGPAASPGFRPDLPHPTLVRPADPSGLRMILPSSINARRRGSTARSTRTAWRWRR